MSNSKGSGLYVGELLNEWTPGADECVTMKHPFACGEVIGAKTVRELALVAERPLSSIRMEAAFADENIRARCWTANFQGREIKGVTATLRNGNSVDVKIMLSSFPATGQWRDEVRRASDGLLPADAWELPKGTDTSIPVCDPNEPLDPRLPFPISDDIVFKSPVLAKPISGAKDVELIIAHASAVYGPRDYGPRLSEGPAMLSFWTASVSGVPLEAANLIQVDADKRVKAMTLSFRPWPVVKLFRDRVRARTEHFMERSYFELV